MKTKLVWMAVLVVLCADAPQALALGEVIDVTKTNQAQLGLEFTLVAERVDSEAVIVRMEIPRKGKLQNIRSIELWIGSGRPQVAAALQTSNSKNGSSIVTFQLSPEFADKASVNLIMAPERKLDMSYIVYAVQLKGYITDRKQASGGRASKLVAIQSKIHLRGHDSISRLSIKSAKADFALRSRDF